MTFKVGDYGWVWDGVQWTPWRSVNPDQRDAHRPLLGFTLFIWIKRVKLDEAELQRNIQVLGGRVARLLDDAVTFVVTDQDPTKPPQHEPLALSRGHLILSRAQKSATEATEDLDLIDRVRQARIKLWSVSQFLRWVEVHLNIEPPPVSGSTTPTSSSRKRKASRLPRPLVKLEDVQQEYKPVYKVFKSDPAVYVNPLYPSSPFDDPAIQDRFVQPKRSTRAASCDSEDSDDGSTDAVAKDAPPHAAARPRTPAAPANNKHQYCECCNAYFFNLQQHIAPDGTHHREFALREDNFECVKELIDCFPSLDDFVANGGSDHAMDRTTLLNDMHPSAYHLAMLNASAAATYRAAPPFPRAPFDPGQVMVKQEPQDDPSPAVVHPGLPPVIGEQGATAVPLDFSRTSQLSDICGQSFPREYVHHHVPPPVLPHPPFLPEKAEEPQQQQQHPCWIGATKMDTAVIMPPHNHHHHQPPVSMGSHLPLENLSFLDQPHQDAMFTSELPQPDFSFGLQNLLHSICDEAEEDPQRRNGGSRSIDSNKENVDRAACGTTEDAGAASQQQQHFHSWPYSDTTSAAMEAAASSRCQPSVENSSSSPLELTAHNNPSELPLASAKQTAASNRRRHSRDDEDTTSNGTSENNPNRWTVERTRRGVGLKLKFTPARKQGSSLMSPPPPTPTRAPRGRAAAAAAAAAATAAAAAAAASAAASGSSTFDVYDWNDEEDSECSDFVKMQWRVLHTEDTKVILCRTKQFALPRKQGKHVGGGKQLVY